MIRNNSNDGTCSTANRRTFLSTTLSAMSCGLVAGCRTPSRREAKAKRPNILLILVDDLGYGDLRSYGATDMQTPHIDQLQREGMRFTNFYANCPVCSPTRAALLSGRYQDLVGVPGVIRTHANNSWGYLSQDARLLPEILQENGYATALVGKWHLGLTKENHPNRRGFDHVHGFLGDMMDDYYTHRRHDTNYMCKNHEVIDPPGHATDLFSDWASDYIVSRKDEDEPFFLYLAYNAPHTPIQPPKEWLEVVQKRELQLEPKRAKLVALIEHMDNGIGRVLETLKVAGMEDDTLVIFSSDNGGQVNVGATNGSTRDGKGSVYEGGLRVPTCARWPGRIQPGSSTDRIGLSMDLMPTILEAAGVSIQHEIDGVTTLPTMMGKKQAVPKRDLFFRRMEGGKYKGGTIEAIRRGDWKLLRNMPNAPLELYNLKGDPLEQKNLAEAEPAIYNQLKAALDAQLERYHKIPWKPPGIKELKSSS